MRKLPLSVALLGAVNTLTACSSHPPDRVIAPSPSAEVSSVSEEPAVPQKTLPYPDNRADDAVADTLFGVRVPDPYRWLEDPKGPGVAAWMTEQDELARKELHAMPEREAIKSRLAELLYLDSVSAPRKRGNRTFYSRRLASKEKAIVYFKDGPKGEEKVLFDPNTWSDDGSVTLGVWVPSWDGKKVAYTVKANNRDEATLYVWDVDAMKQTSVGIRGAKYAHPSWTPQSDGFYYTWLPTDVVIPTPERPGFADVRFHKLGSEPNADPVVHGKTGDARKFIDGTLSFDGSVFFVSISLGWASNSLHFRDGKDPKAPLVKLADEGIAHYQADAHAGSIYVMTDEGAPRSRIFKVNPKKPSRKDWVEIVKEDPTRPLESFSIVGGKLVLSYLDKASNRLAIHGLDGAFVRDVELPGLGTITGVVGLPNDPEAYFGFESFTSPSEIYALDVKTGKTRLYSKVDAPVDPKKFISEQVVVRSKDGTAVTMFIVRPKDVKMDGNNRVFLYGYGGFQINKTPFFWSTLYPWLERGGILAMPNLRGGAEYGEAWHQDGMLHKKQNVFDDFISSAKFLIDQGYTNPKRMVISGASNGGLLVGAAMTQAPDLFAGVLCGVPLLDMVRYHQFGSGRTWIGEYGSSENEADFKALFAYSPYHHVTPKKAYPALLMLAADSDDRVDPMHARKFSAMVQDRSTGGMSLLRIEKNSGHGGADQRKAEVEKGADTIAFALKVTAP